MPEVDIVFTPKEKIELLKKQKASFEKQADKFRFRVTHLSIAIALGWILLIGLGYLENELDGTKEILTFSMGGIAAGSGIYVFLIYYVRFFTWFAKSNVDKQLLKEGAANLQDTIETDFVTKLVQINFKYLDQYYEQTQNQANKSFF
ncbi:hypothetical protein [Marinomonas mediterranea]|nr:hypothetical protein [Marinomonas mediterranea]WCN09163.1 hypothetical protein GV055_09615 [Marinomonas mediterranea]